MTDTQPSLLPPHLQGGNAEAIAFGVESLRLQSGEAVTLPESGVTAIVGGNNVGKSTVLRQIADWSALASRSVGLGHPSLINELSIRKNGSEADLAAWLEKHSTVVQPAGQPVQARRTMGGDITVQHAVNLFAGTEGPDRVGALANFLVHYADAKQRFSWVNPIARRQSITDPAQHPFHQFEDDPASFNTLSDISTAIFGRALTLDFLGGAVTLRVGIPEIPAPPVDNVTPEYRSALARLTPLQDQGDGMCSVLGLMIPVVASTYPVLLIDEPEAFLHPPQARALGKTLGDMAGRRGLQIILATHDRNLLAGLLDAPAARLTVVRLSRDGDTTRAEQLSEEAVRATWSDPVLRHTHVLDGLFHQVVVIAENERDCSFYAAAAEAEHEIAALPLPPHDALFLSSHGKSGMARLAKILRGTGVRVVATPDLDLLNDKVLVRVLVESLGGDWQNLESLYDRATNEFQQPRVARQNRDVLGAVSSILTEEPADVYTAETKKRVAATLAVDSPWRKLKEHGEGAMRADRTAARELLQRLDDIGLVLVKVGELERFGPDVTAGKGDRWLPEALASGVHKGPAAREHVRRLFAGGRTQM